MIPYKASNSFNLKKNVVIFSTNPPTNDAQRCKGCSGWIVDYRSFSLDNNGPFCYICWKKKLK